MSNTTKLVAPGGRSVPAWSWWALAALWVVSPAASAQALDGPPRAAADAAIRRGLDFLRGTQQADGSWSPQPGPAVTAMVLGVLLDNPETSPSDPAVDRALDYVMGRRRPDGGIHDGFLENYNTAICLSALVSVRQRPGVADAVVGAQEFLRRLQWQDQPDPTGRHVDAVHPFYGGAGYGRHGRPDLSNTQLMLQGLYDSGVPCDDPAFQRALVFIGRCQGIASNEMLKDRAVLDGGFIYATSVDAEHVGQPQSMAGSETVDEPGAGPVSRLRTYGSMTYAGFKSYVYARLGRDDPRVVAAWGWIRRHYSVDRNPGMPADREQEGYYYYLMTMARALAAWGEPHVVDEGGVAHDWAADLVAVLAARQRADGSWANSASRWMETDANLVTAYALIALGAARR